jgi:intracellular sulfur oxidation DsrE/DsrF family protein
MKLFRSSIIIFLSVVAFLIFSVRAMAALPDTGNEVRIDIPVVLKKAKVVFNMDHAALAGDTPIGLSHMGMMVERFKHSATEWSLAGIFHGAAGYMLLNDEAYNMNRRTKTGNPFKATIEQLLKEGVLIEECGVTMKANNWTDINLLPGVKVNSGANFRIVELVQQGYVMLQP